MLSGERGGFGHHKGHGVQPHAMFLRCGHVEATDGGGEGETELLSVLDQDRG